MRHLLVGLVVLGCLTLILICFFGILLIGFSIPWLGVPMGVLAVAYFIGVSMDD